MNVLQLLHTHDIRVNDVSHMAQGVKTRKPSSAKAVDNLFDPMDGLRWGLRKIHDQALFVQECIEADNMKSAAQSFEVVRQLASNIKKYLSLFSIENSCRLERTDVHDMNNAFHGLYGMTECICRGMQNGAAINMKSVRTIMISAKVILQIMDVGSKLREKNKTLSQIVHDAVDLAKACREDKIDEIAFYVDANDEEVMISQHVGVYMRSIMNLVINAIDAVCMDRDHSIVWINVYRSDDRIHVSVIDNGCGIRQELIDEVFKSGFTTKGNKGSGLGLYYTKRAIETCGGSVSIETQEMGVTVHISLPY